MVGCKTLCSLAHDHLFDALKLLEKIELGIASIALKEKNHDFPRVFKLLSQIAISQGIIEEDIQDLPSLKKALEKERGESLLGLSNLKQQLINNSSLINLLKDKGMKIEDAVYAIKGMINAGMRSLLSDLLSPTQVREGMLSGLATQEVSILGKLRFALLASECAPAQEGEILVIDAASPEVHKYGKASAIISSQGGIFSHAAITFSDLGIPALLGCDIEALKAYNGEFIHLKLGEEPSFSPLQKEVSQLIERFSHLTLKTGSAIEELPEEIKEIAARNFYRNAFQKLDAKQGASFLIYPLAKECFKEARTEVKQLIKRFWKTENELERGYLLNSLEQRLNQLKNIVEKWDLTVAQEIGEELMDIKRNSSTLPIKYPSFGKSGKKENLDRLQEILPSIQLPILRLNIPSYSSFEADELVGPIFLRLRKRSKAFWNQISKGIKRA